MIDLVLRYAHCSMLTSTGLVIIGGTGEHESFEGTSVLEFSGSDVNPCNKCGQPSLNAITCAVSDPLLLRGLSADYESHIFSV